MQVAHITILVCILRKDEPKCCKWLLMFDAHLNKVKVQYTCSLIPRHRSAFHRFRSHVGRAWEGGYSICTYNKTDGDNDSTNLTNNRIKEVGGVRLSDSSRLYMYMLVSHGSYHSSIHHIHPPPHIGAVCLIQAQWRVENGLSAWWYLGRKGRRRGRGGREGRKEGRERREGWKEGGGREKEGKGGQKEGKRGRKKGRREESRGEEEREGGGREGGGEKEEGRREEGS